MKVIGVGLGRTGTLSLKVALERLGFAPCYHMLEVFENPRHVALWAAAAGGRPVNWDDLFGRYHATTDWPAAAFWRSLVETYPAAKVVLTVRDPERWYESIRGTIYEVYQREMLAPAGAMPPEWAQFRGMVDSVVWQGTFGGRFEDRGHAIEVFERHARAVLASVPPERLLVYEVAEGWGPLCDFLGVAAPGEPMPHLNDAASFHARIERGGGPTMFSERPEAEPPGPR